MTRAPRKRIGFYCFGISTILIVFVMLCITALAALTQLAAHNNYKQQMAQAEAVSAYYTAEEQAYLVLAEIDQKLAEAYTTTHTAHFYYIVLESQLADLDYGLLEKQDTGYTYTYEIPISDDNAILVILHLQYPASSEDTFYTIDTWKIIQKER